MVRYEVDLLLAKNDEDFAFLRCQIFHSPLGKSKAIQIRVTPMRNDGSVENFSKNRMQYEQIGQTKLHTAKSAEPFVADFKAAIDARNGTYFKIIKQTLESTGFSLFDE